MNERILQQGIQGEEQFQSWLEEHGVPFIRLADSISKFFPTPYKIPKNVRLPDYLISIDGGVIVDVKNQSDHNEHVEDGITRLSQPECTGLLGFWSVFRIPTFVVFVTPTAFLWTTPGWVRANGTIHRQMFPGKDGKRRRYFEFPTSGLVQIERSGSPLTCLETLRQLPGWTFCAEDATGTEA